MKFGVVFLGGLLALAGCEKKPEGPPRAQPVREDGGLELVAATFNVRYENDDDRGRRAWRERVVGCVAAIREMDPDVLGIQEALHGAAADLRVSLPDYGFYGVGRDDGRRAGEYAAIFFKESRFEAD